MQSTSRPCCSRLSQPELEQDGTAITVIRRSSLSNRCPGILTSCKSTFRLRARVRVAGGRLQNCDDFDGHVGNRDGNSRNKRQRSPPPDPDDTGVVRKAIIGRKSR